MAEQKGLSTLLLDNKKQTQIQRITNTHFHRNTLLASFKGDFEILAKIC